MDQLVRQLFSELAGLTPAELEQRVRAELESLLLLDLADDRSLSACVSDTAAEMLSGSTEGASGDCGPYHRVRLIGSGGMATVYLAERRDGQIEQRVAVKLLNAAANRPEWRERFLQERLLLSSLNHPSIVRVIDAGYTRAGEPYLAMEYVEGVPIDTYAAEISIRERLRLFLGVCDGVSEAHRHLIIHRDLKPRNILVDSVGQPKLLDFGIAKLLDDPESTQTAQRLLTPGYASPEQLRGGPQTTATDIYSLGAVLYKLLTGRLPRETGIQGSPPADAEPFPLPSRVNPAVSSDLDYILRKALRFAPQERYTSVDAFADDIRAVLECRPVRARSGDGWYRIRRFVRRYWLPVSASAAVVLSLAAGLYISNRQRAVASRRFQEVRQLSNKLFDIDSAVRRSPGTTQARQLIVDTALEYLRRLASEVRSDPDLTLDVATGYMRVARMQGVPMTTSNLGQTAQAERSLQSAEALLRPLLIARPDNRAALLRMAQVTHDRMMLLGLRRSDPRDLVLAAESIRWLDKYLASGNVDPGNGEEVLLILEHASNEYRSRHELEQALLLIRRAIGLAPKVGQPLHAGPALQVSTMIHRDRGELDQALQDARESQKILSPAASLPNQHQGLVMNYAMALIREGEILGGDDAISMGRPEEAIAPLERAFAICEGFARQDPNDANSRIPLSMAGLILGGILRHSDPHRALDVYDHTLRRLAEIKDNPRFRRDEVKALAGSSDALLALGRAAQARRRLDDAFQRLNELKLYPAEQIQPGSEPEVALRASADWQLDAGNPTRGLEIYAELLDRVMNAKPQIDTVLSDAYHVSNIWAAKAALHRRAGQIESASALDRQRQDLWQRWDKVLPHNSFVRRQLQ